MTTMRQPFVVITSIAGPTDAVRAFRDRVGTNLIVVGDRKTPSSWVLPPVDYIGPDAVVPDGGRLAPLLPWNHYSRKVLGYLRAITRGAAVIYDTDDDNAPKDNWGIPAFDGPFDVTADDLGFVNVYRAFTSQRIWPRGFPLRAIRDAQTADAPAATLADAAVGVWQSLADGDPDVDAIYRLVDGTLCTFADRAPLVLGRGTLCPFNSQATAFRASCFPLMYLPSGVTSRVTDILRGLVAQPILWAAGLRLGFTTSTVFQERNPHDLLRDFSDEIPLYLHTETIIETVTGVVRDRESIADNLMDAYEALGRGGLVDPQEPTRVEAWLRDLDAAG